MTHEDLMTYLTARKNHLFDAEMEYLDKINETTPKPLRDVYWNFIRELAGRRNEIEQLTDHIINQHKTQEA